MTGGVWLLALLLGSPAQLYELRGKIVLPAVYPRRIARLSIFSVSTPYSSQGTALNHGIYKFRKLPAGLYTLAVFVRGPGEILRQTVDVGPGEADANRRVVHDLNLESMPARGGPPANSTVTVRQLSVPDKAAEEYRKANARFEKHDTTGGVKHLEKALAIAPQFAEAWNTLGTVEHKAGRYVKAEECFRKALEHDPSEFQPLVNLGGTLISQRRFLDALAYNRRAVEAQPGEPLAQCQLGWNYLSLGNPDEAQIHFLEAKKLDPDHFSAPQLGLAEIYSKRNQTARARAELEDFLRRHPDDSRAPSVREAIGKMRQ